MNEATLLIDTKITQNNSIEYHMREIKTVYDENGKSYQIENVHILTSKEQVRSFLFKNKYLRTFRTGQYYNDHGYEPSMKSVADNTYNEMVFENMI